MKVGTKVLIRFSVAFAMLSVVWFGFSRNLPDSLYQPYRVSKPISESIVLAEDTVDLPMPHGGEDPNNPTETPGGVSLNWPSNINYSVDYDPVTGNYVVYQTIGDSLRFRMPTTYTLDEYLEQNKNQNLSEYWNQLQDEEDEEDRAFAPKLTVKGELFDRIFGGNEIEIKPQGSAELTFGINVSNTENPRIPLRQRRITTFDFRQRIQLNVVGNIGTKMQLSTQYNTEATFDFENQMKLEYTGEEDEIIKKIEAGNVSLPLTGTLISGSTSLFGLKLETQFGKLRNTSIFSQQRGERKEITVEGGAQTQNFDIRADNYEANKHYFLSNWFRDQYDRALESLPVVNSGVNITRIEVWAVNQQANTQDVRNVLAFSDIGENPTYMSTNLDIIGYTDDPNLSLTNNPNNSNNEIFGSVTGNPDIMGYTGANAAIVAEFPDFQQGIHYERVGNARKLSPSEFTYNARLGFISLRQALNNAEVLAVAYEYTLNGETFQVGTLSQDGYTAPSALALKMLKSSITTVVLDNGDPSPLWDQMMKNVYSMGAFGVSRDNFRLGVWYNDPSSGVDLNYIPREPLDGDLLIQVLNMDQLDVNGMANPDGIFDYVDNAATVGGTIEGQTGRIFFPVVEPFGEYLADQIRERLPAYPELAESVISTVVYQPLYDSTKTAAQQIPSLNRFRVRGQFSSSSSSEISLNAFNVPQGSVTVTAGGVKLVEGQDYTVDYTAGRVRILNEGLLDSGQPINVSLESNSLFNIQTKTMLGSRFDYEVNDDLAFGATILNLRERPLTQKVNIGDEPVNNTILGADVAYRTESGFLTKLVDRIPLIDTKEKSTIDMSAEGAYLIPGTSRAIGRNGNAYLDDFEGSQSTIDIRALNQWFLASTPKLQNDLFPEGVVEDDLQYGFNRAKLSWYIIDPQFFRGGGLQDAQVSDEVRSDHRMREVLENEVFPNRELPAGTPPNIATLDLTYYPEERGPYNYLPADGSQFAQGINPDGTLEDPSSRWGGIQRQLTTTDFEAANIEFIQFWLMDPFNEDSPNSTGGDLYFNLGNVSEDVLNDSQLSYENGLPSPNQDLPTLISTWGVYPDPATFNVVNAFDNSAPNYTQQDIGIDGLNSNDEQDFFADWLASLQAFLSPDAYQRYLDDPSGDDYEFFRSAVAQAEERDILERYKNFNGYEGNADVRTPDGYPIAATTIPNTEDINGDITLGTIEAYYQYRVSLRQGDLGENNIGDNFITDSFVQNVNTPTGDRNVRWYQFKIPVREYQRRVGSISDFRSIRFIRMFMKGWEQEVTLRFARLELIRGEWRPFLGSLQGPQEVEPGDPEGTTFNIGAVNIEENGNRDPIPYVTPPGIQREIDVATANQRQLNEQSLALITCNLEDGDARAAYRNVNFDMRMYEKLKMFAHAEAGSDLEVLNDNDVTCFVRLGSDFDENYYEYELPLKVTPWFTGDDEAIWPEENDFEIEFKKLQELKIQRPTGFPVQQIFSQRDGNAQIKIKGNPNLANVIVLMIGVRNPDRDDNPFGADDGLKKCVEVWANELRLTDFNQEGGWAAVARVNATLADFGNISVAGNISTPGFGTLEQRVQERQQETIMGVDANSTLQLGKFFPEHFGVQLPLYLGYSETVTTPRFDPLRPDIEIDEVQLTRPERKRAQQIVRRKSINVSNFRIAPTGNGPKTAKEKDKKKGKEDDEKSKPSSKSGGGKSGGDVRFYDISNFSFSYGYNETYRRDINMEFQMNKQYQGGLNYNFTNKPLEVKPFNKLIGSAAYLKWLKDFNFNLGIKSFAFSSTMDRTYEVSRIRNNTEALFGVQSDVLIPTQVLKQWNWNRTYNFKYDITKNLKFDLNATNLALIGEPTGIIDPDSDSYQTYRDTVWNNIQNFGETTSYNHNASLSYKLPFDKVPILDFVSGDARYQGSYRWDRAPFAQDTLGNTIQNSRNLSLNLQANLVNLYNKSNYLKDINNARPKRNTREREREKDGFGQDEEDDNRKKKKSDIEPMKLVARFFMMLRNVSGAYSRNEGLLLPGYAPGTQILGMDQNFEGPGVGFIFGQQNTDLFGNPSGNFALDAANRGWLVQQPFLNQQYSETYTENWNVRANVEPIKYLKIELTANRTESRNEQSFFRFVDDIQDYEFQSPMETGNFSATIISWPTAFVDDDESFNSETFDAFLRNRLTISSRLNDESYGLADTEDSGYYTGWGPTSQDVTIPAFIAAYTGQDPSKVNLDPFATKVRPNWRITYDGLTKIPSIKKRFKQFNLSHTYQSTMTTSYVTNLSYEEDPETGLPTAIDQSEAGNYIAQRQINTVTISEQLSPLVGFDMTLKTKGKNDPQLQRDRTVTFGLSNFQITETKSNSLVVGVGYKLTEIKNPFARARRSRLPVKFLENTELALRADLTIRDNATIIRKMEERQNQVTAGQRIISIKTSADLDISRKLTLRFFYDHQLTRPKISTSFPTSNIASGITLRFTLS